jgi:hypothetical protein
VGRVNNTDTLDVNVEMTAGLFSDTVSAIPDREDALADVLKSMLGIAARVHLGRPPKASSAPPAKPYGSSITASCIKEGLHMTVNQISVFLENKLGTLVNVVEALGICKTTCGLCP